MHKMSMVELYLLKEHSSLTFCILYTPQMLHEVAVMTALISNPYRVHHVPGGDEHTQPINILSIETIESHHGVPTPHSHLSEALRPWAWDWWRLRLEFQPFLGPYIANTGHAPMGHSC